jgi:hypothetical protein
VRRKHGCDALWEARTQPHTKQLVRKSLLLVSALNLCLAHKTRVSPQRRGRHAARRSPRTFLTRVNLRGAPTRRSLLVSQRPAPFLGGAKKNNEIVVVVCRRMKENRAALAG